MSKKIIYDDPNCETFGEVHIIGNMHDYTLCGLTMDGDRWTAGSFESTNKPVTCVQCLGIVSYCKSLTKKDL